MYTYGFAAEFLALIISAIIFAFTHEKKERLSEHQMIFRSAVVLNIFSIFLNLLTLIDAEYASHLPMWMNYAINGIYFAICFIMIAFYCVYLIKKLLSHVYEEKIQKRFLGIIYVTTAIALILLLVNNSTGIMFFFSDSCEYTHGPLWIVGYLVLGIMLGMLAFCFRKYYTRIDYAGRKFLFIGIPVTCMLFVYQIVYPDFLLNGTMGAFVACLCYLCFESHREEMDPVTKLGSLSAFLTKLDMMESSEKTCQIIVVNLKNFGNINTSFGFSKGNELLYYLATWLKNRFPEGEVYRFAPVSFGVILPYEDPEPYTGVLSERLLKLHEEFPRNVEMDSRHYAVNPFFVELVSDGKSQNGTKIMEVLEYGIQTAKKEETEMLVFDHKLQEQLARKKYLTQYLVESMENHRFEMWYQPIYCTETGRFCSAEALMRLKDAAGNYISPEEFIPLAEETGLISRISQQTMEDVVKLMHDADQLGICQVSLNLSMQQLQSHDYMKQLLSLMKQNGIHKGQISYEITERVLVSRDHRIDEILHKMLERGYTLLMDDFGTGYSNFSMVLDYPFQKIKIDKSILYSSEKDNYKMIAMLVQLFHAYGKKIVVEGVETKEQAETLCRLGVDHIQGFYYAKPMPEIEYRRFMKTSMKTG